MRAKIVFFWITGVVFATGFLGICDANSLRDPFICGQPQCTPSTKFQYNHHIIYHYEYNVTVNTWFSKASENQSTLEILAEVSLEFFKPCEGILKIHSVKMKDQNEDYLHERQDGFAATLKHNILRFAFHDGAITEVCPQTEEENWVINFKRGILSAFQNTMPRFDIIHEDLERDVHGKCLTQYTLMGQEGTSLLIRKRKNLMQCTDRYKYMSILQTVRYNFQSKYQTWPVLQSESMCKIVIDHNVYTYVACRERHLFEPFSGRTSGAMTTGFQTLKLVKESNKTSEEIMEEQRDEWNEITHRYQLTYNHIPEVRQNFGELKVARDILKHMCKLEEANSDLDLNENIIKHTSSKTDDEEENRTIVKLWGELVRASRALPYPSLSQLLNRANTICPQARKHILDALPYIASIGSVQLIKEMILSDTASEDIKEDWLLSMALIPRPQKEMILSMGDLLKHNPSHKSTSLAASSMVHSYCRNNFKSLSECCKEDQNMAIIEIIQNNIIERLAHGSQNLTRADRQSMAVSIKSLGNIGGYSNEFQNTLIDIIENKLLPISIRLDAVDAFRKTSCPETRSYFLHIFGEQSVNVEIRLAAYLQVMRCPKYVTILEILRILKNEKIQQVSSFVWSHLENLEKSTIPSRVEKQGLLSGNTIPKPNFRPDIRIFSRNYEHGIFFDEYNAGGNYEANVILSPDSYIPRSASVNLTVDMFGESINILELNARGEGFETYIEQLFDENGPLSRNRIHSELSKLRVIRENKASDEVKEKIESLNYENPTIRNPSPLLNLGFKVFGNEISYWNIEGDGEMRDTLKRLNPLYHINKILSGEKISYKKSSLFLDTVFSVPTGCGLPLTMNLLGTSVVNIKMSGSMVGLDKVLQTKTLSFEGRLHPSMSLNIAATMSVLGGGFGGTGIRINMKLHTATAFGANVNIDQGKVAAISVYLPHSKQEIFEASSEIVVLHGHKEIKQMGIKENKVQQSTCTWSVVDMAIGIKMCATYSFPNLTGIKDEPYFIMAGPANYLLSLEKADLTAKVYDILYSWTSNDTASILSFSFDTPGSETKRIFNSSISSFIDSGTAEMSFQSTDHTLKAHGKYKNFVDNKLLECVLDIDGQKHFDAVFSIIRQNQKNGYVYIPRFHVAVNNERIMELSGTLRLAQKKGVSQCDVSLEFQTKRLASRVIGYITWNGPSKGTKLRLDYQFLNEKKETIKLDALLSNRDLAIRKDVHIEFGLDFSSYPHLNFFIEAKYTGTSNHVECNVNLSPSRELKGEHSKLQYSLAKHKTLQGYKLNHRLILLKPYLDLQITFNEDGALKTFSTTAQYDKTVSKHDGLVGIWSKLYIPRDDKLYIDAALNVTLPTLTPMILQVKLHEKRTSEYDFSAHTIWFTATNVSLVAVYQDQSTSHLAAKRLKAIVNSSAFKEIAIESKFTQDNQQVNIFVKAEQDKHEYSFLTRYMVYSEGNISCYGQLNWKEKLYTINLLADINNNTNFIADLHIDNIRDIHVKYVKINSPEIKRIKGDINWDANRDPNQKVSLDAEFLNKGMLNYAGSFHLFYPGRLINGNFDFLVKDWLCQWLVKLGWSPDDNILWRVKMFSETEKETMYALLSEMDTPFPGWRDTSLNFMWKYLENFQMMSGNMTWEKEKLVFEIQGDYLLKTNEVFGEIKALINSTFEALPNVATIVRHKHLWKRSADTLLSFEYNDDGLMMFNSSWRISKEKHTNNILGRVEIKSPIQGYKEGLFDTNFSFTPKRDIIGLTHLSLEESIFKIIVDGHLYRFTNNMLVINITSPMASYSLISARFGLVDHDHHLVAMVQAPNITTGLEIIYKINSYEDFHLFSHIALPIEVLQNAMLQAKRNSEEIDLRVGWGKLEFGFTGIWHFNSKTDFQYLYKLYTPISDFEESGLVLKNFYRERVDSEISLQFSKYKVGFAILLENNGKGLLQIIDEVSKLTPTPSGAVIDDFSTEVFISVDTLYYPTVKFIGNIHKRNGEDESEIVEIRGILKLPSHQEIILTDKFILEDFTTMSNTLKISTPYKSIKEIKINQIINCIIEESYNITMKLSVLDETKWKENLLNILYTIDKGDSDDYTDRVIAIDAKTALDVLPFVNIKFDSHSDDVITKVSMAVDTISFHIESNGHVEVDVDYFDVDGNLNVTSPYIESANISTHIRYESSDVEKSVLANIKASNGEQINYILSSATWGASITNQLNLKLRCFIPSVIPPSEIGLVLNNEPSESLRVLIGEARIGSRDTLYSINAEQRIGITKVILLSPHKGFRNVNLTSEILKDQNIVGVLKTDTAVFNIQGNITNKNPSEIIAILKPVGGGEVYTAILRSTVTNEKYSISATLIGAMQFTLHLVRFHNKTLSELSMQVDSSNVLFKEIYFKNQIKLNPNDHVTFKIDAKTPLKNFRNINAEGDLFLTQKQGLIDCNYNITTIAGNVDMEWRFLENDVFVKAFGTHNSEDNVRDIKFKSFYFGNKTRETQIGIVDTGCLLNIDDKLKMSTDAKLIITPEKIDTRLSLLLPKPNVDMRTLNVVYNDDKSSKTFDVSYKTDISEEIIDIHGKIVEPLENFHTNVKVDWGKVQSFKTVDVKLDLKVKNNKTFIYACDLSTPLYENEETFKTTGVLDGKNPDFYTIRSTIFHPGKLQISDVDITYGGTKHSFGRFNTTTPFKNLPWLSAEANIYNEGKVLENILRLEWTNNTALFNSTHTIKSSSDDTTNHKGFVNIEIPLSSQHVISGDYTYDENPINSAGNCKFFYNGEQFIEGNYKRKLTVKGNLNEKDTNIELDNSNYPLGINYIHSYNEDETIAIKQASVYKLRNATHFNLTGRFEMEPWQTGKQVKLMAFQGNRTIKFENKYEGKERSLFQSSKIEWAPGVWLYYDINLENKTMEIDESQEAIINLKYPKRNFALHTEYHLQDTLLEGLATFNWSMSAKNRTVHFDGRWENPNVKDLNLHDVKLALVHPSFDKDITLLAKYMSDFGAASNISIVFDYSPFESDQLVFYSSFRDKSNGPTRKYLFDVDCKHPSTNLLLLVKSDIDMQYKIYNMDHFYKYKKTLYYEKNKRSAVFLDLNKKNLQYARTKDQEWFDLNSTWNLTYPNYNVYMTVNRTSGNDTGIFLLAAKDRYVSGHFNRSDDVSYHMIGKIVDARFADFQAWRDYEDTKTIDIASYIRLNHSRLLTSRTDWRPQIYQQVRSSMLLALKDVYEQIYEVILLWKNVPIETHSVLKNVWGDVKPKINELLDDLNDLHLIKDDIEEFHDFLKESYDANEFYTKDLVEFGMSIVDQLSLRDRLENLPKIVTEISQVMGETGQSLRKSILWTIDTVKTSYSSLIEKLNQLLEADLLEKVSELMESAIMKYDSFIKQLHLSFVNYFDVVWRSVIEKINMFWGNLLKIVEPMFLRFLHYFENFVWKFSRELFDFFYARTNEFTDSPFFVALTEFGHDLDRFYKDMMYNDMITNIKIYSDSVAAIFKEKILVHIPFQKEFKEVGTELWHELSKLQNLTIVKTIQAKFWEAKVRLQWWYDYFKIGEAVSTITKTLYVKVSESIRNAIQNEEIHRKAKTNFIFDPIHGVMLLEQKLPAPWHAFNRTPDFTQISEYKMVHDFLENWFWSNETLLSYFYRLMPYKNLENILPPFTGHSIITGYGTIVTLDRKVFTISNSGTFLLMSDFMTKNFSILLESNKNYYNLVLLADSSLIHIDLFEENVSVDRKKVLTLPTQVDDWIIQREEDFIQMENIKGVAIKCDLQYKVCVIDVNGWYFAQLGGLCGTMNNEPSDDMLTPSMKNANSVNELSDSWKIMDGKEQDRNEQIFNNETVCETYFKNKVSPLKDCFNLIDSTPFYDECVSGMDSCTLAYAYMKLCYMDFIPVQIPEVCMQCIAPNGEIIEEGEFNYNIQIPNSTDVVFIIEAHPCNENIRNRKNIDMIATILNEKFLNNGFTNNTFSVIGYGGQGIYSTPHTLYTNNVAFVNAESVGNMIEHIVIEPIVNSSFYRADAFEALSHASKLKFRPGVSKTFILFPCTKCDGLSLKFDYTVVHQVLLDSSVTLHIIMNDEFALIKRKAAKTLLGIDHNFAYTLKDVRELKGDPDLRNQIKMPKAKLGYCSSLAMETNGTIFNGNRMLSNDTVNARRAIGVFSTRISRITRLCSHARCECQGSRLKCSTCPRRLPQNPMDDISLSMWDSSEMNDFIDNFIDININSG